MPSTRLPVKTPTRTAPVPQPVDATLPEHDVRRKKPPLLSFLLRMDTLRSAARVLSLLFVDLVAVFGAIFTALALKEALLPAELVWQDVYDQTREIVAFVYLVTVLLFARGDLYARRSVRPGLTRIVASLTQVTLVALGFAIVQGEEFSSYYIFYGSLAFAVVFVGGFRFLYDL